MTTDEELIGMLREMRYEPRPDPGWLEADRARAVEAFALPGWRRRLRVWRLRRSGRSR